MDSEVLTDGVEAATPQPKKRQLSEAQKAALAAGRARKKAKQAAQKASKAGVNLHHGEAHTETLISPTAPDVKTATYRKAPPAAVEETPEQQTTPEQAAAAPQQANTGMLAMLLKGIGL